MTWSTRVPTILFSTLLAAVAAHAQPKPILIGQTYVQTGPLASLSTDPLIGIRALIASVNSAGGVLGRPVELKQLDDASDPAIAGENVKKLVLEGAVAILMPISLVRSITEASIIFIIPMPPTISEMEAMAPRTMLKISLVRCSCFRRSSGTFISKSSTPA